MVSGNQSLIVARGFRAKENTISGKLGYEKAYSLAQSAHEGQFRRDGKTPYFEHVKQVIDGVEGWEAKMVAALHDTVEDKRLEVEDLRKAGLPESVIAGVQAMTHPKGMPYQDYIRDIVSKNPLAKQVKLSDIKANLSDAPTERQKAKYAEALKLLVD